MLCLLINVAVFVLTVVLAMMDTADCTFDGPLHIARSFSRDSLAISGPFRFFVLTMCSIVVLNSANGIYQNSVYGLAADLPMNYSNAVVLGDFLSKSLATYLVYGITHEMCRGGRGFQVNPHSA